MESLSTKYRPKEFDEVVGQNFIIQILKRQLELGEFKNCYLFCGPSGCGKTTVARIFANKINDGIGFPIEIDAASNNGVDNVKNIVSEANERSLSSKYKIYIIDECHSLTTQAWQAFLKCIEEPPTYTIFIFATTDPQKVPATIVNRCMRFDFQKISTEEIKERLRYICKVEGFSNYEETIDLISKVCKNQCRDSISLLDKVSSYSKDFDINVSSSILGIVPTTVLINLTNAILDGNEQVSLKIIKMVYENGIDLKLFVEQFMSFILDILKYYLFKDISFTTISKVYETNIKSLLNFDKVKEYYLDYLLTKILSLRNDIKLDPNYKNTIEVAILQMCRLK